MSRHDEGLERLLDLDGFLAEVGGGLAGGRGDPEEGGR
jgi:hypothetical protein